MHGHVGTATTSCVRTDVVTRRQHRQPTPRLRFPGEFPTLTERPARSLHRCLPAFGVGIRRQQQ